MRRPVLLGLVIGVLGAGAARAERPAPPVVVDPWIDGTAIVFGLGLWLAPGLVTDQVERRCDPCDPRELNGLDRAVRHYHNTGADRASDALVIAVPVLAAAGTLASKARWGWRGVLEDATLIAESMVASGLLNQVVKLSVQRPRPFMYTHDARPELRERGDAFLSFYSGHTAATFSAATSFAYTYTLRHPGSDLRPLVWVLSLLAASAVPFCRVASGEHFWTDVMVGAAVGGGVGILVPALHRRRWRSTRVAVSPSWVGLEGGF